MGPRKIHTKVEIVDILDDEVVSMKFVVQKVSYPSIENISQGRCATFNLFRTCESVESLSIPAQELVKLYESRGTLIFPVVSEKYELYNYNLE